MLLRGSAAPPRPAFGLIKLTASFAILLVAGLEAEPAVSQMLDTRIRYNDWQANQNAPPTSRNTGQLYVSKLCEKSQFPAYKQVEGAVLVSTFTDIDLNCTLTFGPKSASQHFIMRFEELKLGCSDHLRLIDGDTDYGPLIKDFSCRDSLASVPPMRTNSTYLLIRYLTDNKSKQGDGFRLVITAVIDSYVHNCPNDYSLCRDGACISKSLFCDNVHHCLDKSDEDKCSGLGKDGDKDGIFPFELTLALGLLIVLVLIIFTCVVIFIASVYCRRDNQHQLQRVIGIPLQTSSSVMFANHQPHYNYFQQPSNPIVYMSPQQYHQTLRQQSRVVQYQNVPDTSWKISAQQQL